MKPLKYKADPVRDQQGQLSIANQTDRIEKAASGSRRKKEAIGGHLSLAYNKLVRRTAAAEIGYKNGRIWTLWPASGWQQKLEQPSSFTRRNPIGAFDCPNQFDYFYE